MRHIATATWLAVFTAAAGARAADKVIDDYPAGLALARSRKVPLFIEAWAPW